jgi:hypothetical protein
MTRAIRQFTAADHISSPFCASSFEQSPVRPRVKLRIDLIVIDGLGEFDAAHEMAGGTLHGVEVARAGLVLQNAPTLQTKSLFSISTFRFCALTPGRSASRMKASAVS